MSGKEKLRVSTLPHLGGVSNSTILWGSQQLYYTADRPSRTFYFGFRLEISYSEIYQFINAQFSTFRTKFATFPYFAFRASPPINWIRLSSKDFIGVESHLVREKVQVYFAWHLIKYIILAWLAVLKVCHSVAYSPSGVLSFRLYYLLSSLLFSGLFPIQAIIRLS